MPTTPRRFESLIFRILMHSITRTHQVRYRHLHRLLRKLTRTWTMPVSTLIHGRPAVMNFNYTYPYTSRRFPTFNNPLIELVFQVYATNGEPVRLVDVGAAIGDTVLLVEASCPGMVSGYTCIDGDREFFAMLEKNTGQLSHCRCIFHQLSASRSDQRSLVRIHGGTASAQGETSVPTASLDEVLADYDVGKIDVLKIDVDGFDGEVLRGGRSVLRSQRPAVIFEWHPGLCEHTGNSPFMHFEALQESGYQDLLWMDKFGTFSHFGDVTNLTAHRQLAEYCRKGTTQPDWHFDIIALPTESRIDQGALAEMAYASSKKSQY